MLTNTINAVCVHCQKFSSNTYNHTYMLPRFDPIALSSKLSLLPIYLNFLLPKPLHTLSVLIITILFQLDVPEKHWEDFVDVVQN